MKAGIWPQLEQAARNCTPVLLTLGLVVLNVVPVPVPGYLPVTPMLTLISVFYWSIYRPDLFPLAATFGVGIVQDILCGTPVGMSALVLLLVQGFVVNQRRPSFFGRSIHRVLAGASCLLTIVCDGRSEWILAIVDIARAGSQPRSRLSSVTSCDHSAFMPVGLPLCCSSKT